jgi:ferredoxin
MAPASVRSPTFVIDKDRCMGCGACLDVCFPRAITVSGTVFTVDPSRCDGCGLCARYCPLRAVAPAR